MKYIIITLLLVRGYNHVQNTTNCQLSKIIIDLDQLQSDNCRQPWELHNLHSVRSIKEYVKEI